MKCNCENKLEGMRTMEQAIAGALKRHNKKVEEKIKEYLILGYSLDDVEVTTLNIEKKGDDFSCSVILTQTVRPKKKS